MNMQELSSAAGTNHRQPAVRLAFALPVAEIGSLKVTVGNEVAVGYGMELLAHLLDAVGMAGGKGAAGMVLSPAIKPVEQVLGFFRVHAALVLSG